MYVPVVTLSTEDNARFSKLLSEGFNRSIYWNEYKVIDNRVVAIAAANEEKHTRELLNPSCNGVKRLFVLAYANTTVNNQVSDDSYKEYFLPRFIIENYNIEIDGRGFYDQPINDLINQYDEVRKISTEQGDDYTTGYLMDFASFKNNYRLIAADLSKQKALDADKRQIQQMIFTGKIKSTVADTKLIIYYILERSKQTIL